MTEEMIRVSPQLTVTIVDRWREPRPLEVVFDKYAWEKIKDYVVSERDQELGRWRWAENPDYVVYPHPDGDFAHVVSEVSGDSNGIYRDAERHTGSNFERAAVAYFAAHPEPKPWHDREPGEVWEVTYLPLGEKERTRAFQVDGLRRFRNAEGVVVSFIDKDVVSARRIWPESEES